MGFTPIPIERDTTPLLSHCVRERLSAGQYILPQSKTSCFSQGWTPYSELMISDRVGIENSKQSMSAHSLRIALSYFPAMYVCMELVNFSYTMENMSQTSTVTAADPK